MSSSAISTPKIDSSSAFSPLFWIPQSSPPSTETSSLSSTPCWYLGNTEIELWCSRMGKGLSHEMQTDLHERVKWVVQAALVNVAYLKSKMPSDLRKVHVASIEHEGKLRHLFLFKNTLFFSLKPTASGSSKTAIPMIDLQTGTPLIRLRMKIEKCFEAFFEEYRVLQLVASPGVLHVLGSASYTVKGYPVERKPRIDGVDPEHRHSILTPAYDYCLYQLCRMHAFTDFTKLTIALAVATALKNIHAKGYLHNDLKTNNVFLNEDQELTIADYGLSRAINHAENETHIAEVERILAEDPLYFDKKTSNLTTPHIAAPELPRTFYTEATDIFAYGCVLLEICGKNSLFDYSKYAKNRFYHSKITEADYNAQLESIFGARCPFDCIENITRDAMNYRATARPSLKTIIQRLNAIRSYFPRSQQVLLPQFNTVSPIANLYLFHTNAWEKNFAPAKPHFSFFNNSFSSWVNSILQRSSLLEADREKYLRKARRFFEEITPSGNKYRHLLRKRQSLVSKYFLSNIRTDSGESIGHVIGLKSKLLYRSPPIRTPEFNIRATYSIETGIITNVLTITPRNHIANKRIKLHSCLPDPIRHHASLMSCEFISYQDKKNELPASASASSTAVAPADPSDPARKRRRELADSLETDETDLSKIMLLHTDCPQTYSEALNSPTLLTATNLLNWMVSLTDFVALLHENNLLLGKLDITELGINERSHLVIKYLTGLTEKSSLTSSPPCLSLFGDIICEKNDVKNLAIVLFIFVQQLTHPKPLAPEETYKTRTEQLLAISDQAELDSYIESNLPKKSDEPSLSNILRSMISIDPLKHISSREAHRRLLALDTAKKESFM